MRWKNNFFCNIITIVLFTILIGVSCSRSEYEVLDSRISAGINFQAIWMDDNRVMFYGGNPPDQGVFIWDTHSNSVTKYADADWKVCYDRDTQYIYYGVKRDKDIMHVMHGKIGEEVLELIPKTKKNIPKLHGLNPFTCVPHENSDVNSRLNYTFLKHDHGYITREHTADGGVRIQYVNGDGQSFPLPIYFQKPVGFFPWKNAYFVWNAGWARGGWLYPEKGFEEVSLEAPDPKMSGSKIARPLRNGFLYISHDIDSMSDPGKSGIYVFQNGHYVRAIVGIVDGVSISPDGCKAAFVHEPSVEAVRQGRRTVKMIDICKAQEEREK